MVLCMGIASTQTLSTIEAQDGMVIIEVESADLEDEEWRLDTAITIIRDLDI